MTFDPEPLPGYPEPYGLLAAILQDGTREWRWELDPNLSEDAVVWQPYPGTHSIGALMLHIIGTEIWWFERVVLDLPFREEDRDVALAAEIDPDNWKWPAPPRKPLAWYFELHNRIRARTLEGIKSWPPADEMREQNGMKASMRWILGHVIQHESYHGGQAVLLSRLYELKKVSSQTATP